MEMQEIIDALREESRHVHELTCDPDTRIVMGEGSLDSDMMVVGEAPGAQEDRQGRPFVGAAGQLLDQELERAAIDRRRVYITNVVKCRPTLAREGRKVNRAPTAKETRAWMDVLNKEIEAVRPEVILCLGAVSASALIHPKFAITSERGKWFNGPLQTRIMATYHPAYLLRAQQYGNRTVLMEFRRDLDEVHRALVERRERI